MARPVIMWIFISLFVLIAGARQTSAGSTSPRLCSLCDCQFTGALACESRNISQIPSLTGKANFSLLFFHNNSIKFVRQFPKLRDVRELVLSNNAIADIEDSAFKNLINLVVLDLSHNLLNSEKLQPQVFRVCGLISCFISYVMRKQQECYTGTPQKASTIHAYH